MLPTKALYYQQVNELPYNEKCDIWSMGCLLYEMAALAPPFEAANQLALAVKIKVLVT
jgi:serine/threonine protein kinase